MKIELSHRGSGLRFTQSFFTARDLRSGFRELDPTGRFYLKPSLKIGRKEVSVVGYAIAIATRRKLGPVTGLWELIKDSPDVEVEIKQVRDLKGWMLRTSLSPY
ncbi:hypothetical protein Peur_005312 [Populus x canadensis]